MLIGYFLSTKLIISPMICSRFFGRFSKLVFGFILITIGARNTPSAMVGIIMLTEAVFGPYGPGYLQMKTHRF